MSFSFSKFIKGIRISKENTVTPSVIDIIPGGTANTTTTLQGAQTANRTVILPDENGTVLTTASTIALSQLQAVATNKALQSDGSGHISASGVTSTELGYVAGVTSGIQTQLDTLTTNLGTETTNRIAGDASLVSNKANVSLNNILPTASVNINGQKITNSAAPTTGSDLTNKTYVDNAVTGGGANLTLSNLTSPVAVNQDLLPSVDQTQSLGSTTKRWLNAFIEKLKDGTGANSFDPENRQFLSGATVKLDYSGTNIDINTRKITNVVNPTSAQDVATKNYVDNAVPVVNQTFEANNQTGSGFTLTATEVVIPYGNVVRNDMAGSYNTSTSVFTAPFTGKYLVNACLSASGTLATTGYFQLSLVQNTFNSQQATSIIWGTGGNNNYQVRLTQVVELSATNPYVIKGAVGGSLFTGTGNFHVFQLTYLGA